MFQSPRGDFGFLKRDRAQCCGRHRAFQSPRGDFGFLKVDLNVLARLCEYFQCVSIPSRGFWFFEALFLRDPAKVPLSQVSIPSRGFWFFEAFLAGPFLVSPPLREFQSPRGDFGFLKTNRRESVMDQQITVSIPSRGFWFFEETAFSIAVTSEKIGFNPLAGILVF